MLAPFLEHIPPIPAINTWFANYPELAWLVTGDLLHCFVPRLFNSSVFQISGICDIGDAAAAGQGAVEGSGTSSFKRKRGLRAQRLRNYMNCPTRQLWATCTCVATIPFKILLARYQGDEGIYNPCRMQHESGVWLPRGRSSTSRDHMPNLLFPCNRTRLCSGLFRHASGAW